MKKLYVTRIAPNPRKALILLASKGIDVDDMDDIDVIDIDFAKKCGDEFYELKNQKLEKTTILIWGCSK